MRTIPIGKRIILISNILEAICINPILAYYAVPAIKRPRRSIRLLYVMISAIAVDRQMVLKSCQMQMWPQASAFWDVRLSHLFIFNHSNIRFKLLASRVVIDIFNVLDVAIYTGFIIPALSIYSYLITIVL